MIGRGRDWLNTGCAVLLSAAVLAGCGGERAADGDGARTADSGLLTQLQDEYPRLGEEPLPEPAPDGAAGDPPDLSEEVLETITGDATFYANTFEGRRTASGIPFRQNQMVAAHRAYPFGTLLRVTNMRNNRSVNVRVVDRGPHGNSSYAQRTVIDLSRRAAEQLGYVQQGRTAVRVEVLQWGRGIGS